MEDQSNHDLEAYYQHIWRAARLPTRRHAQRWSAAVLQTLGTVLGARDKRRLARALPRELADYLRDVFWLLHFRNPGMSDESFLKRAAMRAGNTDPMFSELATLAVFEALHRQLPAEEATRLADALPSKVGQMWRHAGDRQAAVA